MVLVLCDPNDVIAEWAARGLERRIGPVDVVLSAELAHALRWEHRVGQDAPVAEVTLGDGRRVTSREPCGVLNRLTFCPTHRLDAVGGKDRDYAVAEFQALFLSWLQALPGPMLNRPTSMGLGGHWRHPSAWAALAGRAGLATPPYRQTDQDSPDVVSTPPAHRVDAHRQPPFWRAPVTATVVGQTVVAPPEVPEPVLAACARIAELAGDELLGIDLAQTPVGDWEMLAATAMPDLRLGGEAVLDALAKELLA
jgi:hypothetical protein